MAKEVSTFWTSSGRIDTFEFELVSANDFNKSLGYLSGVKGGSLNFGFDTDLKVSGSLDVTTTKFVEDCIIRIRYRPQLSENQKVERILATCFAFTDNMTFDKGRYHGTIELVSTLARYADDSLQSNFTIGQNKTFKNELARLLKNEATGGAYKYLSDVSDKKCTSAIAFEKGNLLFKGKTFRIMAPDTPKRTPLEKNRGAQPVPVVDFHPFDSRNHPLHFIDLAINSSFSFSLNVEKSTFQPKSLT